MVVVRVIAPSRRPSAQSPPFERHAPVADKPKVITVTDACFSLSDLFLLPRLNTIFKYSCARTYEFNRHGHPVGVFVLRERDIINSASITRQLHGHPGYSPRHGCQQAPPGPARWTRSFESRAPDGGPGKGDGGGDGDGDGGRGDGDSYGNGDASGDNMTLALKSDIDSQTLIHPATVGTATATSRKLEG